MKFVDPKNDIAFRKIFSDESKKEILISFLNHILNFSGTDKEILDIVILNPYQVPKLENLKETILDIRVVDKRNIHYIIEMQVFHSPAFEKRVMYYVSKAYTNQLNIADEYPKLNQVVFLGVLDFILFKDISAYQTRHLILEEKTNQHYFKDFDLHFIELPKFSKGLHELENVKEKWLYFLKNARDFSLIPNELEEPKELREALQVANLMTWTPNELDVYDSMAIRIQDERGRVEYAKEEGIEIGIGIGMKKGLEKGIEKGEKSKALKIAKVMLEMGTAVEMVAQITDLSVDEVKDLIPF